tara:strand:- start:5492 stop:6274 length:783 start_codon:yes stop_codon:yes gene_type:complete
MMRWLCAALLWMGGQASALEWLDKPAVAKVFEDAGVHGTFVLHEVGSEQLLGYNRQRAETRYLPASTFKIPNTLIGLSTGAVSSVDEVFPYDGQPKFLNTWEHDMGLREALKVSNVAVYQELARRVGLSKMRSQVAALDYGNAEIGEQVDQFWLKGPLAISAVEQTQFLARLVQGQLPIAEDIQVSVREICLLEEEDGWRLYGKTGWGTALKPGIGWWVGWLEQEGRVYSFALNMPMNDVQDAGKRVELGKASLKALGLL